MLLIRDNTLIIKEKGMQPNEVQVVLPENLEPVYSNSQFVIHDGGQFVLDFMLLMPGVPTAKVKSRIILAPVHMKKLLNIVSQQVAKFEERWGEIRLDPLLPDEKIIHPGKIPPGPDNPENDEE
jgi:hypothetical protein